MGLFFFTTFAVVFAVVAVDEIVIKCIFNFLIKMQIFIWNGIRKWNWNRNRNKKLKAKPCQQHQLTKDIFVDTCYVFFLHFSRLVWMPLADGVYFCVIKNTLCELKYVLCTLCVYTTYMSVSCVLKFTSLMDNNGIDSIFELFKPFSQWTTDIHTQQCTWK